MRNRRAMLSRRSGHRPFVLRHRLAGPAAEARGSPRACPRGRRSAAASGLTSDASGWRRGRLLDQVVPAEFAAVLVPHPAAFLHQPQAGDVLQQADRVAHAALVGEVQLAALVVDHRLRRLDAHQRPGAEADVAPIGRWRPARWPPARPSRRWPCRACRAGPPATPRKPVASATARPQRPQRACPAARSGPGCRVGKPNRSQQFRGPILGDRVVELGGAAVGHFVGLLAGQQPVEQVGHHQQRLGHVQQRRVLRASWPAVGTAC